MVCGGKQYHILIFVVKFEGGVQLCAALLVTPYDQIALGGNDGAVGNPVFLGFGGVVAQIHAAGVIILEGGVEQLEPVMSLIVVIHEYVIACAHLVYADGTPELVIGDERGHEGLIGQFELMGGVGVDHAAQAVAPTFKAVAVRYVDRG